MKRLFTFKDHEFDIVGWINLDAIMIFIGLTILASFFGVIIASKDRILEYCDKYYCQSYIMPYVAVVSPIIFGHAER